MNIKDLTFCRLHVWDQNFNLATRLFDGIPRKLWEVKEGSFKNIDALYANGASIVCNPQAYLYVLEDSDHIIHGILWFGISQIEECILIFVFAVDKKYQKDSPQRGVQIFDYVWDFLRSLNLPFSIVQFETYKPNAYELLGAKRTQKVTMEIDLNVERPNIESETAKE